MENEISRVSAKSGLNVETLLRRIIEEVPPPPVGKESNKLKLFLVNSWFVPGKNVICLFYVMSGKLKSGVSIASCSSGKIFSVF